MPTDVHEKNSKLHAFASETLHNEVERFWKRSLFFWGFIAAAFVSFGALVGRANPDPDLPLAISCFGLVCSLAWTLANRGSRYWQYAWEQKLKSTELDALGRNILHEDVPNRDKGLWGGKRYSVTRLTIALSDFTVLIWLFLAYEASPIGQNVAWSCTPITMLLATAVCLIALPIGGRSRVGTK